ncbi:MAG: hypothetical protein AAF224_11925 [Pseudomonadota bacterium]
MAKGTVINTANALFCVERTSQHATAPDGARRKKAGGSNRTQRRGALGVLCVFILLGQFNVPEAEQHSPMVRLCANGQAIALAVLLGQEPPSDDEQNGTCHGPCIMRRLKRLA